MPDAITTAPPETTPPPETIPPSGDALRDPVVDPLSGKEKEKPGTKVTQSVDPVKRTVSGGVSTVHEDGSKTTDGVKISEKGFSLSGTSTDTSGLKESINLGYSEDVISMSGGTTRADGSGTSRSIGLDLADPTLSLGHTTTHSDESATSTGIDISSDKLSLSRSSGTEESPNSTAVTLGRDEKAVSIIRDGSGGGVSMTDKSIGVSGSLKVSDKLTLGGQASYDLGESPSTKDDVLTVGAEAKLGKKGVSAKLVSGNGETTLEGGGSAGIIGVSGGYTSIDRSDAGFGESAILGPSYVADSTKGSGYSQKVSVVASEESSSRTTQQVKIAQKLDARGSYPMEAREQVQETRDKVVRGQPLDIDDLGQDQSAEITSSSAYREGGGLDVLAYDAGGSELTSEVSQRAIARTGEGIRIRDTRTTGRVGVDEMGVGLGLAYSSKDTEDRTSTEVTEYLLDASDPFAVSYAQDYAQLGLLPSWDVIAPEELVEKLRGALAEIRTGYISADRWQTFLAKNSGLVRQINDHVRDDLHSERRTSTPGVTLLANDRTTSTTRTEEATTAVLFSSTSTSGREIQTNRHRAEDGSMVTERSFSAEKDGRSRSVSTSGSLSAESAVRIEDKGLMRYQQGVLDLAPGVLQALGEKLSDGDSGEHLWRNMTRSATKYWQERSDFLKSVPGCVTHQDDQGLWSRVSNERAHDLPALFAAITGPEEFVTLPGDLQVIYAETVAYGGGKEALYQKKGSRAMGSGFDAMAAIALIEDTDRRDEAMLGMATQVTGEGRDPRQELALISQKLPDGGADYIVGEALKGRQVSPDLMHNDPTAWAGELDELFKQGKSANESLLSLLRSLRTQGGVAQVTAVFRAATSKPLEVAKLLAANSIYNPEEFIKKLMAGTPWQQELDAWWGVVERNLREKEILTLGEEIFSKPENQIKIGSERGLGDCGMDPSVRVRIEMYEEQRKNQESFEKLDAMMKASQGRPEVMMPVMKVTIAGKIRDALYNRRVEALVSELESVRLRYSVAGLDDVLGGMEAIDFVNILHDDDKGAIRKALEGTAMKGKLAGLGVKGF